MTLTQKIAHPKYKNANSSKQYPRNFLLGNP